MKLFREIYRFPLQPKSISSSWIVGHSVFFYHRLDWLYLQEVWQKQPMVTYLN